MSNKIIKLIVINFSIIINLLLCAKCVIRYVYNVNIYNYRNSLLKFQKFIELNCESRNRHNF